MATNPTDFNFQVRKTFKFKGGKKAYEGIVTVSIYLVEGRIPDIIRSGDSFMSQPLGAGWGCPDACIANAHTRYAVLLGETPEEIKKLVNERANELVFQLREIHRRNVEALRLCPPDSITEHSWAEHSWA